MEPVRRAVWFIEHAFAGPFGLDDVARASGLSRFHLSRTFASVTGRTVSAYARGRRLTEAARRLAAGEADILGLALSVGYGSHEAFSRAFRAEFGTTPEAVRTAGALPHPITEPFLMDTPTITLPPVAVVASERMRLVGLRSRIPHEARGRIPDLWQRFSPHIPALTEGRAKIAWGAILDAGVEDAFDYVAAVDAGPDAAVPAGLVAVEVPAARWATAAHRDHVSTIHATCDAMVAEWNPSLGTAGRAGETVLMERYGPGFDPATGRGDIAVWVPLA